MAAGTNVRDHVRWQRERRGGEEPIVGGGLVQERFDLPLHGLVVRTGLGEKRRALAGRPGARRVIELLDLLPAFRRHVGCVAAHLASQPGFRQPPVAHHRVGRHLQDGRGFLHAQPAEEPQLDDPALPLVELRQRLQRVVERDEILARLVGHDERLVEGHPRRAAAALLIVPRARVVHEDAPHHASGHREEMRAIVPRDCLAVDQADVRFVDERRRLKAVSVPLPRHAASGDAVQFPVNERNQLLEGGFVASAPVQQQCGDARGVVGDTAILRPFLTVLSFVSRSR